MPVLFIFFLLIFLFPSHSSFPPPRTPHKYPLSRNLLSRLNGRFTNKLDLNRTNNRRRVGIEVIDTHLLSGIKENPENNFRHRGLMAVEARHLNLFPPQILNSREFMMNGVEGNGNVFGTPISYGIVAPLSGTTTVTETVAPIYGSPVADNAPAKTVAMKSDSGLTYAVPVSRKRSRDVINPLFSSFPNLPQYTNANNRCGSFTFLGEDISFQIQNQQLEIDRFIAQHTEKVKMEIEDRRKRYSRTIAAAVEVNIIKNLKAKEEEIKKIGKLNWALEEKVKSLCVENQIWRDLAQTNEANANALRCNLEQVLAQVQDEQHQQQQRADEAAVMDDAQSFCGSNFDETDRRPVTDNHPTDCRNLDHGPKTIDGNKTGCSTRSNSRRNRMCRNCGREEACVLLLPCRHLCLCTVCGSSLNTCPICDSTKTASVHVNLSS